MRRTRLMGNGGAGLQIFLRKLDSSSPPVSITIEDTVMRRNMIQLWVTAAGGSPSGSVKVVRSSIGWPRLIRGGSRLAVEIDK